MKRRTVQISLAISVLSAASLVYAVPILTNRSLAGVPCGGEIGYSDETPIASFANPQIGPELPDRGFDGPFIEVPGPQIDCPGDNESEPFEAVSDITPTTLPTTTTTITTTPTTTLPTSTSTTTTVTTTLPTTTVTTTTTTLLTPTTTAPACVFDGFFSPVDNAPIVNRVKAGSAVPVKFTFCKSGALAIFASGSPSSALHPCGSGTVDDVEQTVTAGSSSLSFDAVSGRYSYVWKTDKLWTGQCRTLKITFVNQTSVLAEFRFT
jgi:hypothetical protein